MKLGQVIEYENSNIFLQKFCRKWGRETSSRPLIIFWKSFIWGKSKCSAAYFQYISIVLNLAYNKSKRHKTFGYWSRDILNFDFSEKGLELVSQPCIVYDFSKKCFSSSILLTDQISLPDYLYFWDIGQNVYCNSSLTRLWRHKFWN